MQLDAVTLRSQSVAGTTNQIPFTTRAHVRAPDVMANTELNNLMGSYQHNVARKNVLTTRCAPMTHVRFRLSFRVARALQGKAPGVELITLALSIRSRNSLRVELRD